MSQAMNATKARLYAPNQPWNRYTPEELGPSILEFCQDHEPFFRRWAEVFYENFQYLYGNHNIRWSRQYGFAVDYDFLRRDGPFQMRAQTNLARVITESLASFIFGILPEWEVDAMDDSALKGKRYKKICQKLLDAYMERLLMEKEFKAAAMIFTLFGQFACEVGWDALAGQLMEIPKYQKVMKPSFSNYMAQNPLIPGGLIEVPTPIVGLDGQAKMEETWEAVTDQMGRQIIDKMFTGDVAVKMMTPFEYSREIGTYASHRTRYWQTYKLMDYDEFIMKYKEVPGQTKYFNQIRPVYANASLYSMATRFFMRCQFTSPPSIGDNFHRNQSVFKSSLFKYKVFVIEHWDKPDPERWPNGRRVVVANGDCTHITEPSYNTNKADGWHPFAEAQWMVAPPSSIAMGPVNDVIKKNRELDIKDSLIATAVRRNMGSTLLIKNGMGLDPQQITGEPGKYHEVNDVNGARWLHDDMPIPPVISRLREMDKEDVYETSGAADALRGEPSTGATSGYQEKIREEREEKRLMPARRAFESAVETIGEKIIACLRANAIKLNDSVMGFLKRSGAGEFTTQDVIAFMSSPIDYGIDIKVVKSSMTVKSQATHQATLIELSNVPAVAQRLGQDAKVLDTFLKQFGAEDLRDQSSSHRDRAQRENEVFLDMIRLGPNTEGIQTPVVIQEDDDDIHMAEHDDFYVQNFEEIRNNPALQQAILAHKEMHRLRREEKLGRLLPGTSLQTGLMEQMAAQTALPTPQAIYLDTQMRRQSEQAMAQRSQMPAEASLGEEADSDAPKGEKQAPQAPSQPSPSPGGGGTIDPAAPAQNTPQGLSRGGI